MSKEITPGQGVWIVERDEDGNASDVSGYMFLAEVADAVIVTPFVAGSNGLKETLDYHIEETAEGCELCLAVFPASDCYRSRYGAERALEEETEDDDE